MTPEERAQVVFEKVNTWGTLWVTELEHQIRVAVAAERERVQAECGKSILWLIDGACVEVEELRKLARSYLKIREGA